MSDRRAYPCVNSWPRGCAWGFVLVLALSAPKPAFGDCPPGSKACSYPYPSAFCCKPKPPSRPPPPPPPAPPSAKQKRIRCIKTCRPNWDACVENSQLPDPWQPEVSSNKRATLCKREFKLGCSKRGSYSCSPNFTWSAGTRSIDRVKALGPQRAAPGYDLLVVSGTRAPTTSAQEGDHALVVGSDIIVPTVYQKADSGDVLVVFAIPSTASGDVSLHYRAKWSSRSTEALAFPLPAVQERFPGFALEGEVIDVTRVANDGTRTDGRGYLYIRLAIRTGQAEVTRPVGGYGVSVTFAIDGQTVEPECDTGGSCDRLRAKGDLEDLLPTACLLDGRTMCGLLFVDPPDGTEGEILLTGWSGFPDGVFDQVLTLPLALPPTVRRSGLGGDWSFEVGPPPIDPGETLAHGCRATFYDGTGDPTLYLAAECPLNRLTVHLDSEGAITLLRAPGQLTDRSAWFGCDFSGQVAPDFRTIAGEYHCNNPNGEFGSRSGPFTAFRE